MVEKGMKCKYKPFDDWEKGEVVAVIDENEFLVSDGCIKIAQYDDSLRSFRKEDIGTKVIFEVG